MALFRTRATARVDSVNPRRKGIVVTELPYLIGPEKVIEKIKDLVQSKRLQGIADVKDLTDRVHGMQLVIEVKNGFNPDAVLEEQRLYRLTPMEESFNINNVALVDGQPRTLNLKDLLKVYVDFRTDVVRRRTAYRLARREERLHLVEGLLVAIIDIDEDHPADPRLRRRGDGAAAAHRRVRPLGRTGHVHPRPAAAPASPSSPGSSWRTRKPTSSVRSRSCGQSSATSCCCATSRPSWPTSPRRAARLGARCSWSPPSMPVSSPAGGALPLEVADDPCWVLLSSTGLLARTLTDAPLTSDGGRSKHDVVVGAVRTTARGEVGLVTSRGRMIRISAMELPALPDTAGAPSLGGGAHAPPTSTCPRRGASHARVRYPDSVGLALGTAQGVVKRVTTDYPARIDFELIGLKDGDTVVGAAEVADDRTDLVFVSSDAQLLHFPASQVRPQGRAAGGMAGIKLTPGQRAVWFGVVDPAQDPVVVTSSGSSGALPPRPVRSR